jgi:hypothetical protein
LGGDGVLDVLCRKIVTDAGAPILMSYRSGAMIATSMTNMTK